MFIQHVKETPDVGHMLDTRGKDKLAVALANANSNASKIFSLGTCFSFDTASATNRISLFML